LKFLQDVGLNYLTSTALQIPLSGGEAQRHPPCHSNRLRPDGRFCIILDEPSIGLHQRDNDRLLKTLKSLRDLAITVIVVEHDEDTIWPLINIIDIGREQASMAAKWFLPVLRHKLKKEQEILHRPLFIRHGFDSHPSKRRKGRARSCRFWSGGIQSEKCRHRIPLGKFVCITGVSGSGKSTLMNEILAKALLAYFYNAKDVPARTKKSKDSTTSTKLSTSTSRLLDAHPARIRPPTPECFTISATCLQQRPKLDARLQCRTIFFQCEKAAVARRAQATV